MLHILIYGEPDLIYETLSCCHKVLLLLAELVQNFRLPGYQGSDAVTYWIENSSYRCTRQNLPLTKVILAKAKCNGHRFIHIYMSCDDAAASPLVNR